MKTRPGYGVATDACDHDEIRYAWRDDFGNLGTCADCGTQFDECREEL